MRELVADPVVPGDVQPLADRDEYVVRGRPLIESLEQRVAADDPKHVEAAQRVDRTKPFARRGAGGIHCLTSYGNSLACGERVRARVSRPDTASLESGSNPRELRTSFAESM